MSDVALLRGSQAAHTQPICHGHAQGSKQPANNNMGSGHVTPTAKNTGGGPTPQKAFSWPWEPPGGLPPQPRCAHPRPNHPPYPYQSSQRQRPRFHRRNGARRSPNRHFVCGPATATEQPLDSLTRCHPTLAGLAREKHGGLTPFSKGEHRSPLRVYINMCYACKWLYFAYKPVHVKQSTGHAHAGHTTRSCE